MYEKAIKKPKGLTKIWRKIQRLLRQFTGSALRSMSKGKGDTSYVVVKSQDELPTYVRIEASTLCQLNCPSCYMRINNSGSVGKGFLKFEDFKKFLDGHSFIKTIELSNSGEIFLNPELMEIIKYAHSKNVQLRAGNGVNFNTVQDEMLELLVKYKFSFLTISIDGASQEIYSQYRINGNFDTVISNIKKLNEYKKKYNSKYPKLRWQYVIMSHNENEVAKAKKLAKALGMDISFKLTWDRDYIPKNIEMLKMETGLAYFSRKDHESNSGIRYATACHQLFNKPQINWDGRLLGCCCVYKNDFGVNVFEVGLDKALNSDQFTYAKKMLQGKALPPEQKMSNIPCVECPTFEYMLVNKSFLRIC